MASGFYTAGRKEWLEPTAFLRLNRLCRLNLVQLRNSHGWWRGVAVTHFIRSLKLLYGGPS